jgi:hypothetical protein
MGKVSFITDKERISLLSGALREVRKIKFQSKERLEKEQENPEDILNYL